MKRKSVDSLLERQRHWATGAGIAVDDRGYVKSYEDNLRQPLSAEAKAAFVAGSGTELEDGATRPAKMRALHSSSALAVNVFDYWSDRDSLRLTQGLEVAPATGSLRFEKKFPTGLKGIPPNLDVVLTLQSGLTLAIESKFTEWLTPKLTTNAPFKAKYFESGRNLWAGVGLPECQRLAHDVQEKAESFVHLNVPQLLKHALGLATNERKRFSLCYLYYDWPCPESEIHHLEVNRFASRVGSELLFRAITYQDLFRRLTHGCGPGDNSYVDYLRSRYFKAAT